MRSLLLIALVFATTVEARSPRTRKRECLLEMYQGATAAFSLRPISRWGFFNDIVTVRRSSDNAESGFLWWEIAGSVATTWTGANDGLVKTWFDQSGNVRNFSQSTAGNQPAIVRSGVLQTANGKPVIDFDGTNDHLRCPAATFITPTTQLQVSVVCKNDSATLSGTETLISQFDIGTNQRSWIMYIGNDEKIGLQFGDPADGTFEGGWASTAAISPINLQTVGFTFNAGTVVLYVNGVAVAGAVSAGSIPTSLFNSNADATIGSYLYSSLAQAFWNGQIPEVYVADNLTDSMADIQTAQMRAFNIT